MRRAWSLAILLALAGCAAPSDPAPASEGAGARTLGWGIESCAFVIAAIPVDEAALAARLPEGFALAPGRLAELPAGPRASIELDAYACEGGSWNGENATPLAYGSHYAAVVAPEALREEGYDATFVKWDFLVPSEATRAALVGLPAHTGSAGVSINGLEVAAILAFDDGGGFEFSGVLQGAPTPAGDPLPFMEFTPLADGAGIARWHARLHDAAIAQGVGVAILPEGSWVRDLVGAERAPATFIAGTWNLDEADVTFPIAWPQPT